MNVRTDNVNPKPKRKPRLTVRGAIDRRMVAQMTLALKEIGEPRKYHWTRLLGYRVADLEKHLESLFEPGMTWERFLAGDIEIDHSRPMTMHPYRSSSEPLFHECWAITNLQPMWKIENRKKGNRYEGKFRHAPDTQ